MRNALILLFACLASSLSAQRTCGVQALPSLVPTHTAVVSPRETAVLPVVVHVVWHSPEENISEAQVESQIEVLNQDFRALNLEVPDIHPLFKDLAADVEVEFCLTAITRTQTPWEGVSNLFAQGKRRVCHTELGGKDAIDPAHYINIWVAGRSDGTLGSATFPEAAQRSPQRMASSCAPMSSAHKAVPAHPSIWGVPVRTKWGITSTSAISGAAVPTILTASKTTAWKTPPAKQIPTAIPAQAYPRSLAAAPICL